MSVYYGMLVVILFTMFLAKTKQFGGMQKQIVFVVGTVLLAVSGLRYYVGTDYRTYSINYNLYKDRDILLFSQPGVSIVARIAKVFYDDYATWFFLMALLTIGLIVFAIYRESINIYLSILLFVLMGMWHTSFNAVKQYAAIAILVWGHHYLIDKNLKKWILVCLLAAMFHITAILMIPVYFLVTRTVNWKQIILLVFVGIAVMLGYELLFAIVAWIKQGQSVVYANSDVGSRNVNILRVMVNCAPVLLYLFLKVTRYFREDKKSMVYANFSVLNGILYIATSSSVYLSRFCAYTDIFGIFFIPYIVRCFAKKNRSIITFLIVLLYFLFWRYDLAKSTSTSNYQWIFSR